MKTERPEEPVDDDAGESTPKWRSRAVERSLERSRAAAEVRSSQFVSTALAIASERGGGDFTVQEVVERMRVSTRTFYQYFTGKDELLVAMFEEVQRDFQSELRGLAEAEPDPIARLEAFVMGILQRAHDTGRGYAVGRLLIHQFFEVQMTHPDELRESYAGMLAYLAELLAQAAGDSVSAQHQRAAALIMHMVVSATQASVVGSPLIDPPPTPDEVWQFCLHGVSALKLPHE